MNISGPTFDVNGAGTLVNFEKNIMCIYTYIQSKDHKTKCAH